MTDSVWAILFSRIEICFNSCARALHTKIRFAMQMLGIWSDPRNHGCQYSLEGVQLYGEAVVWLVATNNKQDKLGQRQSQPPFSSPFWVQKDFEWKFWYIYLRKFQLLTKRVRGRIETFSMSESIFFLRAAQIKRYEGRDKWCWL